MHAVRLTQLKSALIDDDIDAPSAGPGEVVVEIRAAGICHSDAHYRAGGGTVALPLTLGHEIAGVIAGTDQRVALHYLHDDGRMLGKEVDGGYAERIVVPAANAVPIPDGVPFDAAAVMMCSTATAYHALRLASLRRRRIGRHHRLRRPRRVRGAIGEGDGRRRRLRGRSRPEKLDLARSFGAIPAAVEELRDIDVALDFAGHPPRRSPPSARCAAAAAS